MKNRILACLLAMLMVFSLCGLSAFADDEADEAEEVAETEELTELSDELYDFQVKLDGVVYQFPMSFEDFTAMGWEYDDDETYLISPYEYISAETFEKGKLEVYTTIFNLGINTVTFAEAMIGGISVDNYQFKDAPDTEIEFAGGIVYGESTLDDITEAYGTPSDTYEGSMYTKLTYTYDSYQKWDFYVYVESGVLEEFEVRNMVADEEAIEAALAEVDDEPTEEVLAYVAPEELGDDPLSFVVEYAGDLYQLPVPVSVFLENGWKIKDGSVEVVYGYDYDWVYLMKDNQELRTIVQNYNPNATVVENCFVTEVEYDIYGPSLSLVLPGGISDGMSNDELMGALDALAALGIEYEVDGDSDYYIYYTIEDPDDSWNEIQIMVDREDDIVSSIEVTYEPDELPYLN